jgi:glycosyltransferase involved in cell wall biosynthesis
MPALNILERFAGIPLPIWLPTKISSLASSISKCDAVHVHDFIYPGSILSILIAYRWKKTVVLTQHIGTIPYNSAILRFLLAITNRSLGKFILTRVARVVFISNSVQAYYRSFINFQNAPLYFPNGVDNSIFSPLGEDQRVKLKVNLGIPEKAFVCLFVGRFVEKKGMLILAELVRNTPHINWVFAGSGPLHPAKWEAKNLEVFEGFRRERLAGLYRAADLLVLPSRGEGFPLVVQESFACGTPALVSDETAMGCEEARSCLFDAPVTGPNVVKKWEEKLYQLFSNQNLLKGHRAVVSEFARTHWSWEKTVNAYARLYSVE